MILSSDWAPQPTTPQTFNASLPVKANSCECHGAVRTPLFLSMPGLGWSRLLSNATMPQCHKPGVSGGRRSKPLLPRRDGFGWIVLLSTSRKDRPQALRPPPRSVTPHEIEPAATRHIGPRLSARRLIRVVGGMPC